MTEEATPRGWRDLFKDVAEQSADADAPAAVVETFEKIASLEYTTGRGKVSVDYEDRDFPVQLQLLQTDDLHAVIRTLARLWLEHTSGGQVIVAEYIAALLPAFEAELERREEPWNA